MCKVPVLGNVLCDVTDLINDLLHEVTTTVLGPLDDLLEPATQLLVSLLDEVGITNSEDTGVAFRFTALGLEQHLFLGLLGETTTGLVDCSLSDSLDLLGRKTVAYIRGNDAYEDTCLRARTSKLGDIVHSNPVYVGPPAFFYPDEFERQPYSGFAAKYAQRTPMVCVGANDGMLHAFNAGSGREALAFVPAAVFPNLYALRTRDYSHRYYVDGGLTMGDVFFDANWHTVLVGTLGAGGQSVFALDITDPANFSEANAEAILLWEFMDSDHPDLGYVYGQPAIVKLADGRWAAVFGNGFNNIDNLLGDLINNLRNARETTALLGTLAVLLQPDMAVSTTGNAVLYVVDIATGERIRKIDTGVGISAHACQGRPNGLGEITVTDLDGDRIADTVYAGDLCGNLWKFDLSSDTATQWHVANAGQPLFRAAKNGNPQAITAAPSVPLVAADPIVIFASGQYFQVGDSGPSNQSEQSIYAVRDNLTPTTVTRQNLVEQQILTDDAGLRVTSNHKVNWDRDQGWYLDLPAGERMLTVPLVRGQRLLLTTMAPAGPCRVDGNSWLYILDYATGGRLRHPAIDTNADGKIDAGDLAVDPQGSGHDVTISGIEFDTIISAPQLQIDPAEHSARLYMSDSSGQVRVRKTSTDFGRKDWRQLR